MKTTWGSQSIVQNMGETWRKLNPCSGIRFLLRERCILCVFSFWLVLGALGCGGVSLNDTLPVSQIRFVQLAPAAIDVNFSVNGGNTAFGLDYESFSSYLPVVSGATALGASRTDTGQILATAQVTLNPGRHYTALLSQAAGTVQEKLFTDQDTPSPPGHLSIRILNASSAALMVYVTPSGTVTAYPEAALPLASGAASAYLDLPVGPGYVVSAASNDGSLRLLVESVNVKAVSGAVRTVVFGSTPQPGSRGAVVGFLLADADPVQ